MELSPNDRLVNAGKLSTIQQELKVPKSRNNAFGKYNYRSADDILTALKPLLGPLGWSTGSTDRVEIKGDHYYQVSKVFLIDEDGNIVADAEAWAREEDERKQMDAPQRSGSAASYATKRAWGNLLGIDDTQDSDATNTHNHDEEPASHIIPKSARKEVKTTDTITDVQIDSLRALMVGTGVFHLKDVFREYLLSIGAISGASIKDIKSSQASKLIDNFSRVLVLMYSNSDMHPTIQRAFETLERVPKIAILTNMSSHIQEVTKVPKFESADITALNGYMKVFLTAIHDQEANNVIKKSEELGLTKEEAKAELDRLNLKPKEVKQFNLDSK